MQAPFKPDPFTQMPWLQSLLSKQPFSVSLFFGAFWSWSSPKPNARTQVPSTQVVPVLQSDSKLQPWAKAGVEMRQRIVTTTRLQHRGFGDMIRR